jgi:hypothetical protein
VGIDSSVACGATFVVHYDVAYHGPFGSYTTSFDQPLMVGRFVERNAFLDDFEGGDNGFTHGLLAPDTDTLNDDWHHDTPTTSSAWDPASAFSGAKVWGNDLGDHGGPPYNGNYRPNAHHYLATAPIDCTGWTGIRVGFWRWLTVEEGQYDHARLRVSDTPIDPAAGQLGQLVWENRAVGDHVDTEWTWVEYDISAIADGGSSVTIVFELETDGGKELGGWTIDDLRLFTRELECQGAGCVRPPMPAPVGPMLRATGLYDQDGVELTWSGASLGSGEEYRLHRGTQPDALATQLLPAGFTADVFDDRTAPNALYFYTVRKANCAGEELQPDQDN